MKHLKRKFLDSKSINKDVKKILSQNISTKKFQTQEIQKFKNATGFIQTDEDEIIKAFTYKLKENHYMIPEPNPIIIYFDAAYQYSQHLNETYDKVIEELNCEKGDVYRLNNKFYAFFSNATVCITFLFNSMEAFINLMIPDEYEFKNKTDKKTELYNKE
ncbi:MAG: hypothetical protein ACXWEY_01855 [Bacteroidia bacterium]